MKTNKVNINQYLIEYLKQHKLLFLLYILLLFIYPLHRVMLPKYYGKVISSLNQNKNNKFMENVKILLFIFVIYNVLMAILNKVQAIKNGFELTISTQIIHWEIKEIVPCATDW